MNVTLLIVHALCAVFLLGALTHQSISAVWPRRPGETDFVARYRGANAPGYTDAVIVFYLITAILGGIVYAAYRVQARPALEAVGDLPTVGLFELKEHFLVIAFGVLPAYWYFWRRRPEYRATRAILAVFLAANVWFGFIAGHIVNNVRGVVG